MVCYNPLQAIPGGNMKIQILPLLEGAKQATGLTVIIDVFRAFSLEAYMHANHAEKIIPVKTVEEAFQLKQQNPSYVLVGERGGIKIDGFQYGNSPSEFVHQDLTGKVLVHTTSAGVQGIAAATNADEIVTGALVNAKATARYIEKKKPDVVSIVPMGWGGENCTEEDQLCAEYLQALLLHQQLPDLQQRIEQLKYQEGKKFFDPSKPQFPEEDFWLCTKLDIFDGVNRVIHDGNTFISEWIEE